MAFAIGIACTCKHKLHVYDCGHQLNIRQFNICIVCTEKSGVDVISDDRKKNPHGFSVEKNIFKIRNNKKMNISSRSTHAVISIPMPFALMRYINPLRIQSHEKSALNLFDMKRKKKNRLINLLMSLNLV